MQSRGGRIIALLLGVAAAVPAVAQQVPRYKRLADDRYLVVGARGGQSGLANKSESEAAIENAASLCAALDYSYFEVLTQEGKKGDEPGYVGRYYTLGTSDTMTVDVRFYAAADEQAARLSCEELKIEKLTEKYRKVIERERAKAPKKKE